VIDCATVLEAPASAVGTATQACVPRNRHEHPTANSHATWLRSSQAPGLKEVAVVPLGYLILLLAAALVFFLVWLGFCAWVTRTVRPSDAVKIINASGRAFPLISPRRPWQKGG
jgi:hypothetical protein